MHGHQFRFPQEVRLASSSALMWLGVGNHLWIWDLIAEKRQHRAANIKSHQKALLQPSPPEVPDGCVESARVTTSSHHHRAGHSWGPSFVKGLCVCCPGIVRIMILSCPRIQCWAIWCNLNMVEVPAFYHDWANRHAVVIEGKARWLSNVTKQTCSLSTCCLATQEWLHRLHPSKRSRPWVLPATWSSRWADPWFGSNRQSTWARLKDKSTKKNIFFGTNGDYDCQSIWM